MIFHPDNRSGKPTTTSGSQGAAGSLSRGLRLLRARCLSLGGPRFKRLSMIAILTTFPIPYSAKSAEPSKVPLMPMPAELSVTQGRLRLSADLQYELRGAESPALRRTITRSLKRIEERTGLVFARSERGSYRATQEAKPTGTTLVIDCGKASPELPVLGADETYTLSVTENTIRIQAPATLGAQRALETLVQLVEADEDGWSIRILEIADRPRFPWRGLMLDVSRHWLPIDTIKRNIDGMALVKLNVLHLHLSDDQGFRVECKAYPRLQDFGSDGYYFTQAEIRDIIAYASERGIRVVPEFDIPGHATSWVVGYPELASAPGPYQIERRWGVFDPVLDPTREETYQFLSVFLAEMTALFPDPYFHIGGDENNGVQWSANPRIQAFIKEHNLVDNAGLHAYFNRRVQEILARSGKQIIGWDEILHPDLPKSAVIQSWRGAAGLADAVRAGHQVLLSNGYYIDLIEPTTRHYVNDPIPSDTPLTPEQQTLVLGGEATQWAEWVSAETVDSRVWPRMAAIAERLWSPRKISDIGDMYRRLNYVSNRLDEAGLQHDSYREPMLRRYAGDQATADTLEALRRLCDLAEPVKGYTRTAVTPNASQHIPLSGLADCVAPDSQEGRTFSSLADSVVMGASTPEELANHFRAWTELAARLQAEAPHTGPRGGELSTLAIQLVEAAGCGVEIVARLSDAKGAPYDDWFAEICKRLDKAGAPTSAVELPIVKPLRILAAAVREQGKRGAMNNEAWRTHLYLVAFPPTTP